MLRFWLKRPKRFHTAIVHRRPDRFTLRHASTKPTRTPPPPSPPKPSLLRSLLSNLPLPHRPTYDEFSTGIKFLAALVIVLHVFCQYFYVIELAWGISMLPTIAARGDSVVISKYYRRGRGLEVGDVVSFKHPVKIGEYACKRLVGMEGDFVLAETPGKGHGRMMQVPAGHCWVVGDNLPHSRDSRIFGALPLALVTGKVIGAFSFSQGWRRMDNNLQPAIEDDEV